MTALEQQALAEDTKQADVRAMSDFLDALCPDALHDDEAIALGMQGAIGGIPTEPWSSLLGCTSNMTHFCIGLMLRDQTNYWRNPDRWSFKKDLWLGTIVLVLDDVLEKAAAPDLKPTYIIETKPGSQQWGYVFTSPMLDQEGFEGLVRVLAAAGMTDPGALGSARMMRLPGSRPPQKEYTARLVSADWSRRFPPDAVAMLKMFGIDPAQYPLTRREDTSENSAEFVRKWQTHWLNKLGSEDQKAAIGEMLACLPRTFLNEYESWLVISMALHQLDSIVTWDARAVWETWSRGSNKFSEQGNNTSWSYFKSGGNQSGQSGITVFSLLHHARTGHDGVTFDPVKWREMVRRVPVVGTTPAERRRPAWWRRMQAAGYEAR